jgi:hypothetical protein
MQQTPVIDIEAERLGGGMEVGAVDKERDLAEIRLGHIMRDRRCG